MGKGGFSSTTAVGRSDVCGVIDPQSAILLFIVFLYSTVCHEAAHAWVAYRLGDDTAYRGGQVSLDPIPHIKRAPMGMVVLPLIMLFSSGMLIGWGLAPYNRDWARLYPRKDAWVAVAGPAANLVLLVLAAVAIRVGLAMEAFVVPERVGLMTSFAVAAEGKGAVVQMVAMTLGTVFGMNLLLLVINLLPLPPLDGSKLPLFFLRGSAANNYQDAIQNPSLALIAILVMFNSLGPIFRTVRGYALQMLYA